MFNFFKKRGLKCWYSHASDSFCNDVENLFSKNDIDICNLLEEYVHNQFGYSRIPSLANPSENNKFAEAIIVFDVVQLFFASVQFCAFQSVMQEIIENGSTLKDYNDVKLVSAKKRAIFSLSNRFQTEMASIRLLIFSDLQIQGMALVRPALETIEIFTLCLFDDDFAEKFANPESVKAAKHLYFSSMSKNKARKAIKLRMSKDVTGASLLSEIEQMTASFEEELGTMLHPAFWPSMMNVFEEMQERAESEESVIPTMANQVIVHAIVRWTAYILPILTNFKKNLYQLLEPRPKELKGHDFDFCEKGWFGIPVLLIKMMKSQSVEP